MDLKRMAEELVASDFAKGDLTATNLERSYDLFREIESSLRSVAERCAQISKKHKEWCDQHPFEVGNGMEYDCLCSEEIAEDIKKEFNLK